MSVKNGSTVLVKAKSMPELASAHKRGAFQCRTAPEIEEIEVPEVLDIAIPEVKVQMDGSMASLKMVVEQIKAQKAARQTAMEERMRLRKEAKEKQKESIRKNAGWMTETGLRGIHDIRVVMEEEKDLEEADLLGAPSPYPRSDGKQVTIGEQMEEWKTTIRSYQSHKKPLIGLTLYAVEVAFWLSVENLSKEKLLGTLEFWAKEEILCADVQGRIFAFGKKFSLEKRFDVLDPEDKEELLIKVKTAVDNQVNRLKEEAENTEKKLIENLKARATMKPIDILEDSVVETKNGPMHPKEGICYLPTDDGALLVEVGKDYIRAVDAIGIHKNGFATLKELEERYGIDIVVERQSLKNGQGQLRNKDNAPRTDVPLEVSEKDSLAWKKSFSFVWHACQGSLLHLWHSSPHESWQEQEFLEQPARKVIRTFKRINKILTPQQFHKDKELGKHVVKLPKWRWRLKDENGKLSATETVVENLELEFERFEDLKGAIRLKIVRFSKEHGDFLEKVGCLDPDGYIHDPANGKALPFFDRVLRMDHAIKFPPAKK